VSNINRSRAVIAPGDAKGIIVDLLIDGYGIAGHAHHTMTSCGIIFYHV
jgi:hypothetical protein